MTSSTLIEKVACILPWPVSKLTWNQEVSSFSTRTGFGCNDKKL